MQHFLYKWLTIDMQMLDSLKLQQKTHHFSKYFWKNWGTDIKIIMRLNKTIALSCIDQFFGFLSNVEKQSVIANHHKIRLIVGSLHCRKVDIIEDEAKIMQLPIKENIWT